MDIWQIALANYAAFIREKTIPELRQGIYSQMAFVISVLESHADYLDLIANEKQVNEWNIKEVIDGR